MVNFALQFEGNPYVYGGTSLTNGADCSGFVMSVFANFGYSLPRVAAAQCEASTKKDISQLEPGDLVFYETDILIMWHFISEMERLSMPAMLLQESRFPIMIMRSRQL